MEFKDRKATNPGRVILEDVQTKSRTTYDITFADNPTEQGTPLNKQTMDALKEDVLNEVQAKFDATFVLSGSTLTIKLYEVIMSFTIKGVEPKRILFDENGEKTELIKLQTYNTRLC